MVNSDALCYRIMADFVFSTFFLWGSLVCSSVFFYNKYILYVVKKNQGPEI